MVSSSASIFKFGWLFTMKAAKINDPVIFGCKLKNMNSSLLIYFIHTQATRERQNKIECKHRLPVIHIDVCEKDAGEIFRLTSSFSSLLKGIRRSKYLSNGSMEAWDKFSFM